MLNDVFGRAWSARAGRTLPTEYWQDLIPAVKARYQDVLFIAEACWDLEYELMQKGFDYCYDKRLYDRLVHDDAVPRGFFPLLNAGELAIIYCFVFLYLAVAGGGVWSLDHLRAGNKASRAAWRT